MKILQNHYVLAVHDVRESAGFYVEKLGFEIVNAWTPSTRSCSPGRSSR